MSAYKKLFQSILVCLFICPVFLIAKDPVFVYKKDHRLYKDFRKIEEVLAELKQGIQNQDNFLALKAYLPDPDKKSDANAQELMQMEDALANLYNSFENRDVQKRFSNTHTTYDYYQMIYNLDISDDGKEAIADIGAGFVTLPADNSVINELSAKEVSSLSDKEIKRIKRFRPVTLHLKKISGFWRIVSFGKLASTLDKTVNFYRENKKKK